ncbi:class I SAM-dependent methyltransferase [Streptomyces sp. NPDC055632]
MNDFAAVGAAYATRSHSARGRPRHDMVARRLLDELPCPRARILDVGCGDKEMTLRPAVAGHRVTGLDSSSGMLRATAERVSADPRVHEAPVFVEADLCSLPFAVAKFDAVCCHGVLMYPDEPASAVARPAAPVAPGGVSSILMKNRRAIGLLPWQGVRAFHDRLPGDRAPDEDAYAAALETEWTASSHSPFRDMGRQVHVPARRETGGGTP